MITFQQILDHNPCVDGWAKLLLAKDVIDQETHDEWVDTKYYDYYIEPPIKPFPLSDILETNNVLDTIWTLRCIDNKDLVAKIAISLVHQVEHLMTDERSKRALRVAWNHLEGKATREELEKARFDAADIARAAYADAYAAARAAADEIKEKQKQLLKETLDSGECKYPWENNDDCKQQKNWI